MTGTAALCDGYICTDMHAKRTADVAFTWLTTIEGE
jgi:hypothetical protein